MVLGFLAKSPPLVVLEEWWDALHKSVDRPQETPDFVNFQVEAL